MTAEIDQRVIIADDVEWTIYEHRAGTPSQSGAQLVFVSSSEVRRLAVFPEGWRLLEDEGLAWLAGVAVTVRQRRTGGHEKAE